MTVNNDRRSDPTDEPDPSRPMEQPQSDADPSHAGADRGGFERLIAQKLKRMIDNGTKNVSADAVRQLVSELKLPKEAINNVFAQLDETKSGVYRAVSREVRELVERTSLSEEIAKALSLLSLEVKMEVRFKPSDARGSKPASAKVRVKSTASSSDNEQPKA